MGYMSTLYETQRIEPVRVRAAQRFTEEQVEAIKGKMKAKTGASDIKLIQEVDSSLLGGLVIEWGFMDPETLDVATEGIDVSLTNVLKKAAIGQGVLVEV